MRDDYKQNFFGLNSQNGQTEVEFMLILPLFLMVVFTTLLLALMVIKGELVTYATYWGGRGEAMGKNGSDLANNILPGIGLTFSSQQEGQMFSVVGTHNHIPVIGQVSGGSALNSPLARNMQLRTQMDFFRWPQQSSCSSNEDNPINGSSCTPFSLQTNEDGEAEQPGGVPGL